VPPLLEPDQDEVLRAVRERLAPPAVVAAVAKEEEVGHAIVTKAKEVVEAGSATELGRRGKGATTLAAERCRRRRVGPRRRRAARRREGS
jgi:hypothetical protein